MAKTEPQLFMHLIATAEEMWHERKGMNYASTKGAKKRHIAKVKKLRLEIIETANKLEGEIEIIEKLHDLL